MDRQQLQRHRERVFAQWRRQEFSALKSWAESKKRDLENDPSYATSIALHSYAEALKDVLMRIG